MKTSEDIIHIALAFDKRFLTPFYVLLTSIFHNNAKRSFTFHTIAPDIDPEEVKRIEAFVCKQKSSIIFYNVEESTVKQFVLRQNSHISPATYYRFYFSSLVPENVKKLLYLDTDVVVIGDLSQLYDLDLNNYPVAAVEDNMPIRNDLGFEEPGQYFNAGILMMNMDAWRGQKISERAIQFLQEFPEKAVWMDQDALNVVLAKNWYRLEKRFNLTFFDIPKNLQRKQFDSFLNGVVIIHYTTQHKPWLLVCANRLRFIYDQYFKMSPKSGEKKYADLKVPSLFKASLIRVKEFLIDNTSLVS